MRYNDFGIDFKYLLINERDRKFGININTVDFQPIPPDTVYPSTDHPQSYYFNTCKGRILSEYQILYISKGKGTFASESTKETNIEKGQIILLFPGQWHTYCPSKDSDWNEYYIGFEGAIIDNLMKNEFLSPKSKILDVGVSEELVGLYPSAIQVAKNEKKTAQEYMAGIVLHIIGMVISFSQSREFESDNSGQIIERAKVIMTENIHRQINVQQIANNIGTSYSWFRKEFKEYTGFAPA